MEEDNYTIRSGVSHGILEKISFVILSLVAFLTPVFFVPVSFISTQFGTSLLFAFGVILATLVYVVSALVYGSLDLPKSKKYMFGIFFLVPLVYVLAGISNGFSRMSFLGYTFDITTVGFMLLAFVFMLSVSISFKNKNRIFYSYLAFLVSSVLVSLFIIIRVIFGAKIMAFGMFTSLTSTMIGTWNNVGIFFGICAILSLLTYEMLSVRKSIKILLSIALALSLFFLAVVNFKTIWIILSVCSLLFILYKLFSRQDGLMLPTTWKEKLFKIPLYPTIILVIAVSFSIWGNSFGGYLANKMQLTSLEVRPSASVTLDIVKNTLINRPLFGTGPNSFVSQWLSYKPDAINATDFWNTDFAYGIGLIPTLAVTTGAIGVLSWLIFFGFFLYFGIKSIFSKFDDLFLKYLLTSSFFVSLYLWIMVWIYVPSTVIFILTFFFTGLFFASAYIGNLMPLTPYSFSYNPKIGFVSSFALVVVFVGVTALGYGLFKNSKSLWYFQKSSAILSTEGNIGLSENYMAKAVAEVPYDIYYRALTEIEMYKIKAIISQDQKNVKLEDIQKQFNDALPQAINAGLSARNTDPSNYLNWISLGRVYEMLVPYKIQGAFESAQFAYSEALRRNPKNPGIMVLFSKLAVSNGDLKSARNYVMQAIQAKKNYLDAYYLLTQIEVADNNLKGAIDSATVTSILTPNDPTIFFQLGILKYNSLDIKGAIEALEKSILLAPQYANAKYFLGLSYELMGQHEKAIAQFEDLKQSNPDNKDVENILNVLLSGKPLFKSASDAKTEKGSSLPVKEK